MLALLFSRDNSEFSFCRSRVLKEALGNVPLSFLNLKFLTESESVVPFMCFEIPTFDHKDQIFENSFLVSILLQHFTHCLSETWNVEFYYPRFGPVSANFKREGYALRIIRGLTE